MRRTWKVLAWAFLILFLTAFITPRLFLEIRAARANAQWREYQAEWEAKGDLFSPSDRAFVSRDENIAEDPWIKSYMAGVTPALKRFSLIGIHHYERLNNGSTEWNAWMKAHEAEVANARLDLKSYEQDIISLKEAVSRPYLQPSGGSRFSTDRHDDFLNKFHGLLYVLLLDAKIRLISDDTPGAVVSLTSAIHLSRLLADQTGMQAFMVGYGGELRAAEISELGLLLGRFSDQDKKTLLEAFSREPLETRFPRVARGERNFRLVALDETSLAKSNARRPLARLNPFAIDPVKEIAFLKLDYCRKLQPIVGAAPSKEDWQSLDDSIKQDGGRIELGGKKRRWISHDSWVTYEYFSKNGAQGNFSWALSQEKQRQTTLQKLRR